MMIKRGLQNIQLIVVNRLCKHEGNRKGHPYEYVCTPCICRGDLHGCPFSAFYLHLIPLFLLVFLSSCDKKTDTAALDAFTANHRFRCVSCTRHEPHLFLYKYCGV
jgi:hypothetical protein